VTVGRALWPEQLSAAERAQLSPGLPDHFDRQPDVLVVGGGIVGVATAAACQQAGLGSVVLVERDSLGAGASGGAAGQLVPEAHVGIDPPVLVDLARRSLLVWRELEATWPGGVGLIDIDWLGLEPGESQFGTDLPPNAERLTAATVAQLVQGLTKPTPAVRVRHQARVNPLRSIARLAAGLACVATGVDVQSATIESGRLTAVGTSAGEIRPGAVVFATGNPPRLDGLDLRVPWSEVKGHMLVTEPTDLWLPGVVAPLATPLEDGRLMRGGTLDVGDDEHVVRPEVIAAVWAEVEAAWPVARGVRISHQWACFRPAHPDHLPVIDRIASLSNAWITSGHYKTGILLAPATGRALAAWIESGERPSEVVGLEIDRFAPSV
jgi:glycine/D-amino acid oxidase-like deaminating enzyme